MRDHEDIEGIIRSRTRGILATLTRACYDARHTECGRLTRPRADACQCRCHRWREI